VAPPVDAKARALAAAMGAFREAGNEKKSAAFQRNGVAASSYLQSNHALLCDLGPVSQSD